MEIEYLFNSLPKHNQVRVENWTKYLSINLLNPEFKKHRNNITKLLLINCRENQLNVMFKTKPPNGPIPNFDKNIY